jgi:S-adenosylmethionine/arginine decarboxylase-like enzyme
MFEPYAWHCLVEMRQCRPHHPWLTDAHALKTYCVQGLKAMGLSVLGDLFYQFPDKNPFMQEAPPAGTPSPISPMGFIAPQAGVTQQGGGVTGLVLLGQSHFSIHTWPEYQSVVLDVLLCHTSGPNHDMGAAEASRVPEVQAWLKDLAGFLESQEMGMQAFTRPLGQSQHSVSRKAPEGQAKALA